MKLNKIQKLLLLFIIILVNDISAQLTLEYCQTHARENYPLVNQYNLIEKSEEFTLSNATKAYYPQLSVTAIAGKMDGLPEISLPGQVSSSNNYNLISIVQLNQTIWDGGITSANKDIISAESKIGKADLDVTFHKLKDRINNLYFGILLIDENINLIKIYRDNLERNLELVKVAVENGTAYKTDIDEINVELLNSDKSIAELKSNRSAYIKMLSSFIEKDISKNEYLTKPTIKDNYVSLAIKRPELSLLQNQKELVNAKYGISKSSLYPKIGLMGIGVFLEPGVDFAGSEVTRLLVGGLNLSWDIGGLYKNSNNNQLKKISLDRIKSSEETFLFNTNLELTQAQNEIEKLKILIDKDAEILELKTKIRNSYETKYKNGVTTMTELLTKTNDENAANQEKILHEIQYLMKTHEYINLTGN